MPHTPICVEDRGWGGVTCVELSTAVVVLRAGVCETSKGGVMAWKDRWDVKRGFIMAEGSRGQRSSITDQDGRIA